MLSVVLWLAWVCRRLRVLCGCVVWGKLVRAHGGCLGIRGR